MPRHDWSDDSFDWAGLNDAIDIIYWWTRHIGRFGGQLKEKWGCVRFYVFFSDGTLYSIVKPGYYFYRWPRWVRRIDYNIVQKISRYTGVLYLLLKWQQFIYYVAYKRAVDKHPHLRDEILVDADFHELLEGIHGFKHSDHWVSYSSDEESS
jgi:hypothetical protein